MIIDRILYIYIYIQYIRTDNQLWCHMLRFIDLADYSQIWNDTYPTCFTTHPLWGLLLFSARHKREYICCQIQNTRNYFYNNSVFCIALISAQLISIEKMQLYCPYQLAAKQMGGLTWAGLVTEPCVGGLQLHFAQNPTPVFAADFIDRGRSPFSLQLCSCITVRF